MVVDSSDFDVSETHDGRVDDASDAESREYGFVWTADDTETSDRTTTQTDAVSSTEPLAETTPNDQFEWASPTERRTDGSLHNDHNVSRNSEPENSMIGDNATDEAVFTQFVAESTGDDAPELDHASGTTAVSEAATERHDSDESPDSVVIDPINYPVEELRTIADCVDTSIVSSLSDSEIHGFVWSEPPEQHRTHVEDPTEEQRKRLLMIAGIDSKRIGEKPYLTALATDEAETFITDWLEFLTLEAGTHGATEALDRYREIGWMTEPVAEQLKERLQWIDYRDGNGFDTFDRGDHLLNFVYAAKIASLSAEGMVFY
ncbi:FlaD/FlaE family flagellar protein [Halocatena pleomorpha]|uniref:Archaeal flagella protein FlaD/E domain-containing protein n=1 Tax=Halocatena pleomorpha TaxID=1785090 RepID=A0A3P3RGY0_9EURY|nr:FlaD/FlaE family flagellar protein [Halocatena pleomorpha]RRJ32198.1 hypothetical protein EIK79_05380 [Halocatena pleomorpha]